MTWIYKTSVGRKPHDWIDQAPMTNERQVLLYSRLMQCYETARRTLLAERTAAGHWEGELSTSALSTATAVMALEMVRRDGGDKSSELIAGGLRWLAENQNPDGGWGDTTKSLSNISTTMLARAVFHATGTESQYHSTVESAIRWIENAGGIPAIVARYGKDKTFSIPILTHCALAGLVEWKQVQALPFELACLPAKFYKTVKLPVVSYALPALIAIGQVRHHHRKTWNPLTRLLRHWAKNPSLKVLERIQPENGGFLEAAPLTSFVTMSLAGMGLSKHPVAKKGVEFLVNSVRPDGSWPIDTNLATWTTTLAVNALGEDLPEEDRPVIRDWLLKQQYKTVHPYANADPGGWAWTDLPGGVPDADDTPGAILALFMLTHRVSRLRRPMPDLGPFPQWEWAQLDSSFEVVQSVSRGIDWLIGLQNRDGGFPTFCKGWGTLPFDRSAPDITAHCLRALIRFGFPWGYPPGYTEYHQREYQKRHGEGNLIDRFLHELLFHSIWDSSDYSGVHAILRGFQYLKNTQRPDGSWLPLWFGNQHAPDDINPTYGTARVLAAYRDARDKANPIALRGVQWLKDNQNADGGWSGMKGVPSSVEETALATEILLSWEPKGRHADLGLHWLMDRVESGEYRKPTPIGFYFAKLWYFESLYPLIFTTQALGRAVRTLNPEAKSSPNTPRSTATLSPALTSDGTDNP